ncbi:MAG: YceI family protein [Bacteroidetes bacterium]|nr:YceI family protein [Bacteroidota bacterium]
MKRFKVILSLTALFTILFVVRCSKSSDPAPKLVSISGKVTYTDLTGAAANASGAVVYLAKSATTTTTYDQSTIAGADGSYNFSNLSAGAYYLNSVYQTDNKNLSARLDGLKFTTASGYLVTAASTDLTQDMSLVSVGQTATEAIQVSYQWDPNSGTAGAFTNTGAWVFDNIHSPVQFQFPYRGAEADFKGSFIQTAQFTLNFDASNLASSSIVAKVDLLSINTGTPGGRDAMLSTAGGTFQNASTFVKGKLGCIAGTFGITADDAAADPNSVTTDVDRYATFTSTSISTYGDGYLAKGNLVFHGKTVPVGLMFKYVAPFTDTSVTPNKKYVSFEGKITIQAKTDFALVSSSIADLVTIYITVNLNKNL